jgi:hypothetical protein
VTLEADGLDHSGWIIVDNKVVATFTGSLRPHAFALGEVLADGKQHRLAIMFDEPPREQGQLGFTSRTKHLKPRFNYSWDWTPRIVTVGVWDRLSLRIGPVVGTLVKLRTALDEDLQTGRVHFEVGSASKTDLRITMNGQPIVIPMKLASRSFMTSNWSSQAKRFIPARSASSACGGFRATARPPMRFRGSARSTGSQSFYRA